MWPNIAFMNLSLDFIRLQKNESFQEKETVHENIPILPMAFLTFAEAKGGSAPAFV